MSKRRKRNKEHQAAETFAHRISMRLFTFIATILAILLILIFRIGEGFWFEWIVEYRLRLIGFLILGGALLSLSFPLIVEADSNPRPLKGPGKMPSTYTGNQLPPE